MTVLTHPESGATVNIVRAQLSQRCSCCGAALNGAMIIAVSDGKGWTCLTHLETRLAVLPPAFELPVKLATRPRETYDVLQLGNGQATFRTALTNSLKSAEAEDLEFLRIESFEDLSVAIVTYTRRGDG